MSKKCVSAATATATTTTTTTATRSSHMSWKRKRKRRIDKGTGYLVWRWSNWLVLVVSFLSTRRASSFQGALFSSRTRRREMDSLERFMVLTTPESIIEQASTQKLLDDLIDESTRTSARRPIMMQFDPSSGWIWKRWKGTIFSETWDSCVSKMLYAVVLLTLFYLFPTKTLAEPLRQQLQGFNVLWGQMLQVTTFTLTFFLNQSYALWRECYALSRRLQGRLHDINLSLAAHATRKPHSSTTAQSQQQPSQQQQQQQPPPHKQGSTCTAASRQLLELIARYARLFNLLTYASFTRSHRPILTPRGMRRLVERGLMTPLEREVLVNAELPATQRHNAVLLWIARAFIEGWQAGHFTGHAGFENQILDKIHACRAQYGAIGDELSGRMPLAYAHIVQVLVDLVLWMYPFMAISSNMSPFVAVLGTGILTVSYQGLFDLAKQFLDPYDNESFGRGEDPLVVDTLIAETNAGSVRWMNSLTEFPVSTQRIKDGELSDYLLPLRGYSVEELGQMEMERFDRERELQARRLAEEEERRLDKKRLRKLKQAAEAMIPALYDPTLYNLQILQTDYVPIIKSRAAANKDTTALNAVISSGNRDFDIKRTVEHLLPTLLDTPISLGKEIAAVVNRLDDIAGGIPLGLIPPATAAAKQERPPLLSKIKTNTAWTDATNQAMIESRATQKKESKALSAPTSGQPAADMSKDDDGDGDEGANTDSTVENKHEEEDKDFFPGEEFDEEEEYELDLEVNEQDYDVDNTQSLSSPTSLDELDQHGKEYRLSQMLADEVWQEELETTREITEKVRAVQTFEQYTKRIEEIRNKTNTELAETQEILEAKPGAEESEMLRYMREDAAAAAAAAAAANVDQQPRSEFVKELLDSGADDGLSPSATRPITDEHDYGPGKPPPNYSRNQSTRDPNLPAASWADRMQMDDNSGLRSSQVLADQVWPEELENVPNAEPLKNPVTFEEYEKQVAEILEAEKDEMVETAAILNAPSFAESLAGFDDDESVKLRAINETAKKDDLAILEMDLVEDKRKGHEILPLLDTDQENKERLMSGLLNTTDPIIIRPASSSGTETGTADSSRRGNNHRRSEAMSGPSSRGRGSLLPDDVDDDDDDDDVNPPDANVIR